MHKHETIRIGPVVVTLLAWTMSLTACAPLPVAVPDTNATIQLPSAPANVPTATEADTPSPNTNDGDSLALQARTDLANRLAIDVQGIEVVTDTELEVPTGSLGCGVTGGVTNPGMIIGRELVLAADGKEYTYRSDGQRLVPCSPAAFPGGREPAFAAGSAGAAYHAQSIALAALAVRLDVPKDAIVLIRNEPVIWPDSSLGCPEPGMVYAQAITPGFRVVLQSDGDTFEAHTDAADNVVICQP